MAGLEVRDPRLHDLVAPDAPVDASRRPWIHRGPVWRRGELLFSDIPTSASHAGAGCPKDGADHVRAGHVQWPDAGRPGTRARGRAQWPRVSRVADDGTRTVLAERFQGKRLNSPNDIVLKSTAPSTSPTRPMPYSRARRACRGPRAGGPSRSREGAALPRVYRIGVDGRLDLLVDDFALPNGWRSRPTSRCSTSMTRPQAHPGVRREAGRNVDRQPRPADMASDDPGVPDASSRCAGQHLLHGAGGVWVCRSDGALLGRIVLPELPANLPGRRTAASFTSPRAPASTAFQPARGVVSQCESAGRDCGACY